VGVIPDIIVQKIRDNWRFLMRLERGEVMTMAKRIVRGKRITIRGQGWSVLSPGRRNRREFKVTLVAQGRSKGSQYLLFRRRSANGG